MARLDLDPGRRIPVLDGSTLERLSRCLDECSASGVRALVIAGGESGTFAAGADLAALADLEPLEALAFAGGGQTLFDRLSRLPAVTIAAIRGRCIGGAFDLVLSCDLRLAEAGAVFSHPGPRLGFITGWGGTSRLPLLAGRGAAEVLTGRRTIEAAEALATGLVAALAGPGQVETAALELAERVVRAPFSRIALLKEALARLPGASAPRCLERRMTELARRSARGEG